MIEERERGRERDRERGERGIEERERGRERERERGIEKERRERGDREERRGEREERERCFTLECPWLTWPRWRDHSCTGRESDEKDSYVAQGHLVKNKRIRALSGRIGKMRTRCRLDLWRIDLEDLRSARRLHSALDFADSRLWVYTQGNQRSGKGKKEGRGRGREQRGRGRG